MVIRSLRRARVLTLAELCAEVWGWEPEEAKRIAYAWWGIAEVDRRRANLCENAYGVIAAQIPDRYRVVNERRFKAWAKHARRRFVAGLVDAGAFYG